MSGDRTLTQDIVAQYMNDPGGISLESFADIDVAAAEALTSNHISQQDVGQNREPLMLNGLRTLSPCAARYLSRHRHGVLLDGMTRLPANVASALAQTSCVLSFNGLRKLTEDAAQELSCFSGSLRINGLKGISSVAAEHLTKNRQYQVLTDDMLSLNGVEVVSEELALLLVKWRGALSLDGIRELSPLAADALGNHESDLSLSGLTSLTDESAELLFRKVRKTGMLRLDGLAGLSDAQAKTLASYDDWRPRVTFHRVTTLSKKAASHLVWYYRPAWCLFITSNAFFEFFFRGLDLNGKKTFEKQMCNTF